MLSYSVEKTTFTTFQALGNALMFDLVSSGAFRAVYPTALTPLTYRAVLETTPNTDALSTSQPWRIYIDCSATVGTTDQGSLRLNAATSLQLADDGLVAMEFAGDKDGKYARQSGELSCGYYSGTGNAPGGQPITPGMVTVPFASQFWGAETVAANPPTADDTAHPLAYRLTVTDRGIALFVWEEGQDDYGCKFSWAVIQRPVDPLTGSTLTSGKCPVFCMYSIGGGNPLNPDPLVVEDNPVTNVYTNAGEWYDANPKVYRFTVRESDVFRPTLPTLATVASPDNNPVINAKQMVAIQETNQYVLTVPNGFNTARYFYKHELDMVAYTSADVIGAWSDVGVTMYGEPTQRAYKAMQANLPNNAGMRMLVLTKGPGF